MSLEQQRYITLFRETTNKNECLPTFPASIKLFQSEPLAEACMGHGTFKHRHRSECLAMWRWLSENLAEPRKAAHTHRPSPNKIFASWRKSLEWAEIWANISVSHFQPTVSRGWKQANDWYCALCHQPSIYGKENSSVRFVGGCQGRY